MLGDQSLVWPTRYAACVGRARDFTREFLPRPCVNRARWEQIERALRCGVELPPVELFRMDDVYFVVDGHHRISVARAQGAHSLDALVTRLDCALRLTAADFQHGTWLEKVAPHRQEEQERLNAA